jgi:Fur family peroxide stress response transcriptional regulator
MSRKMDDVIMQWRNRGIRITLQVIRFWTICYKLSHPSAEEIHHAIAAVYPSYVSLMTIYNSLRTLKKMNTIREFYTRGSAIARYDVNAEPHHHLICGGCGTIFDYEIPLSFPLENVLTKRFRPEQYYLEVYGTCSDCEALAVSGSLEVSMAKR